LKGDEEEEDQELAQLSESFEHRLVTSLDSSENKNRSRDLPLIHRVCSAGCASSPIHQDELWINSASSPLHPDEMWMNNAARMKGYKSILRKPDVAIASMGRVSSDQYQYEFADMRKTDCVLSERYEEDDQVYAVIEQDVEEECLASGDHVERMDQKSSKLSRKERQLSVRFDPSTKDKISPAPGEEPYSRRHHRARSRRAFDSEGYNSDEPVASRRRGRSGSGHSRHRGLRYTHSLAGFRGTSNEFGEEDTKESRRRVNDEYDDDYDRCSTCSSSSSDSWSSDYGFRTLDYVDLDVGRGRTVQPNGSTTPSKGYWSSTLPRRCQNGSVQSHRVKPPASSTSSSLKGSSSSKAKKRWYRKKNCVVS